MAFSAAGLAINATARSYAQIAGANDRVNFGIIGLHSRASAHLASLKANAKTARIAQVCDVESTYLTEFAAETEKSVGYAPTTAKDFRHMLASKDVDAITIATPDHWHGPTAILGLEAGKHVYVEGEMLVAARDQYKRLCRWALRGAPHRTSKRSSERFTTV